MNIKSYQKLLIPISMLIAAIALSAGVFFLCQPFLKAIEDAGKQEAVYVQEAKLVRDLLVSKNATDAVASRLISKEKIATVKDAINKKAAKNNVVLLTLRPPFVAPDEGGIFTRVLFDMKTTASLKKLGQLLMEIRNMPEGLVDVESLSLLPSKVGEDSVAAKITFVLFVAKKNEKK